MGSRSFISRSLETNSQLLADLWTFEVCHGCLPPHAHGMFEHAHGMFEHAHDMFEHVHDIFEQETYLVCANTVLYSALFLRYFS